MKEHPFLYVFLPLWVLLSFWQAYFAQLIPDEAYYWLYSQNLAWGYFDHPPAVAVMIKAGTALFANEWGVRCIAVLLSTATLWLIYKTLQPKNEWLFITIIVSIVPLHLLSNFAVPDVPLLFFAALFFYAMKRYLFSEGKSGWMLLIVAIAGMFYSKYHASLIIFFTILAAPVVLQYPSFYLLLTAGIAAYVPHILWQIAHNFRTIRYQLSERNSASFSFHNVFDYLGGQLAILGTLSAPLLLFSSFKQRAENLFERVLVFNLTGFLIFFLFMSFRGHVEPNWTTPCWIPLIILSYKYLEANVAVSKWIKPIAYISLFGIIAAKVWLTALFADKKWFEFDSFHGWKKWATLVKERANGNPVVFMNLYQMPSEYKFYAHEPSISHNVPYARSNQFDYWHYAQEIQGRKVMFVPMDWLEAPDGILPAFRDTLKYRWLDKYYSFPQIRFQPVEIPSSCEAKKEFGVKIVAKDMFDDSAALASISLFNAEVYYVFTKPGTFMSPVSTGVKFTGLNLKDELKLNIQAPADPGKYQLYFCIGDAEHKITLASNSDPISIQVRD